MGIRRSEPRQPHDRIQRPRCAARFGLDAAALRRVVEEGAD
jgi:hypothetical protein